MDESKQSRSKGKHVGKASGGLAADLYYWAEALVFALAFLIIVSVFFVRFSGVDGNSMYPTLHNRDQLLVRVLGYEKPDHGDIIVVMAPPEFDEDEPLVKRVIGVGGDVVDIDPSTGAVSVNGAELYEPYINEAIVNMGSVSFPYTIPENRVFVMGDNRNRSTDSRWTEVGAIPYENIIGKVIFRFFPLNAIGTPK